MPTSSYYEAARQQARQEIAPTMQSMPVASMPEPTFVEPMSHPVHAVRPPEVVERLPEQVRASVFDDDFFREPKAAYQPPVVQVPVAQAPVVQAVAPPVVVEPVISRPVEPIHVPESAPTPAAFEDEDSPSLWPEARVPSFAGYAGGETGTSEGDELDIPAFLRKKH
jgi:hypothetical protein